MKKTAVCKHDHGISRQYKIVTSAGFGLLLIIACHAFAEGNDQLAQAVTGKIVIDGVVYGDNAQSWLEGSGEFGQESRQLSAFHSVKVLGGVDVNYRRSGAQQVELSGDQNLLAVIKTQVDQGVLTIASTKSYQTQLPLTVALSNPILKHFAVYGAGTIALKDLQEDVLTLELSGSGDVTVEGRVKQLVVNMTGASDVDGEKLICDRAEVRLTGSGDLSISVKQRLDAQIIGSGDIIYYGQPEAVAKRIIGSGDIQAGY